MSIILTVPGGIEGATVFPVVSASARATLRRLLQCRRGTTAAEVRSCWRVVSAELVS
jgi:hypothetical protein